MAYQIHNLRLTNRDIFTDIGIIRSIKSLDSERESNAVNLTKNRGKSFFLRHESMDATWSIHLKINMMRM